MGRKRQWKKERQSKLSFTPGLNSSHIKQKWFEYSFQLSEILLRAENGNKRNDMVGEKNIVGKRIDVGKMKWYHIWEVIWIRSIKSYIGRNSQSCLMYLVRLDDRQVKDLHSSRILFSQISVFWKIFLSSRALCLCLGNSNCSKDDYLFKSAEILNF